MNKPTHVLLVDDDEDSYVITRHLLGEIKGEKFVLRWEKTYAGGLSALVENNVDVCLLDYLLGERTGIELLKEATAKGVKIPIILMTVRSDREFDLEAMKAGAADYLVKGEISPVLLERSIRYALEHSKILNALKVLNETLEQKVLERTAELEKTHRELEKAQRQLYQAQKMESLGLLAGGLAHDFGNFLNAVVLHANLAFSKIPPENPAREDLIKIRRACEQALELVQEILLFSRNQTVTFAPLDLNESVGNLLKILYAVIGENFSIESRLAPSLPKIFGSPGQIQQVLMNLIVNARDAMPGGGKIFVSTDLVEVPPSYSSIFGDSRPGHFVRILVKDEGMGMDEETLSRIFDPFFTTKSAWKGTGLGLSVVYSIIKAHNGWVDVESQPGKGSTFYIYLPIFSKQ
jgi:signal transduction histidine kinase